jgi:hypothetical protein
MDARDSLSSSTVATVTVSAVTAAADAVFGVAPNRDGLSGTEDDAVLSVAAALAKDAALHFQSAKFAECVEVLNQLFLKKQDDPKVTISLSHSPLRLHSNLFYFIYFLFLKLGFAWRCCFDIDLILMRNAWRLI